MEFALRSWIQTYRVGKTIRVKSVADTSPPMMTRANGRCVSDPIAVEIAIGASPNEARSAVIRTVRNLSREPLKTAS